MFSARRGRPGGRGRGSVPHTGIAGAGDEGADTVPPTEEFLQTVVEGFVTDLVTGGASTAGEILTGIEPLLIAAFPGLSVDVSLDGTDLHVTVSNSDGDSTSVTVNLLLFLL